MFQDPLLVMFTLSDSISVLYKCNFALKFLASPHPPQGKLSNGFHCILLNLESFLSFGYWKWKNQCPASDIMWIYIWG
jgi:hypothetical protein